MQGRHHDIYQPEIEELQLQKFFFIFVLRIYQLG